MPVEFPSGRGNYLLRGIEEVPLPDVVPWRPEAPGAWILLVLLLACVSWQLWRAWRRWRRNAYRRRALLRLRQCDPGRTSLLALPELLKGVALEAYPRTTVAALSGKAWLSFMNDSCAQQVFDAELAECLQQVSYLDPDTWSFGDQQARRLLEAACTWVRLHRDAATDA